MTSPANPLAATSGHGGVSSRLAWATVAFLWFAFLLDYVDRQAVFSIFPALRSDLGFSNTQLGLIGTLFLWVYSLCMPVAGRLGDLIRRDHLVIASLALWSLATLGTGLATSAAAFLLCRAVMGITESLYLPNAMATIAVLHTGSSRSKALAVHNTAQFAGIIGGGWYGGWSADHIGWRPGFTVLAIIGAAYALVLWAVFRGMRHFVIPAGHRQKARPADIFRSPCYWALGLAFFSFCTMLWMLYAWFPNFLYERYHLSMTQSSVIATVSLQLSCVIGVLGGGVFADWLVKRVPSGRYLVVVAGLAGAAPFGYLSLAAGSLGIAEISAAAFGFFAGLFISNLFAAAYDVMSKQNYGLGTGVLNLVGGMAGGAAILVAGLLKASLGMTPLMKWQSIASVGAAILLLWTVIKRFDTDSTAAAAEEAAA